MEPIENEKNIQEEIVTVEPGQEGLTVEEEIKAETPVVEEKDTDQEKVEEEKAEEISEDTDHHDEDVKEEIKEEVIENNEDSEAAKEEDIEEEKAEEESEKEEKEETPTEEDKEEEGKTTEEEVNDEASELEKVKAELEAMKEADEVRKMEEARAKAIDNAVHAYDDFNDKLAKAVEDTFKQYGIDPSITMEELQKEPAKMQIVQDIVVNAQRIQAEKQAELMKPINDASNALVFREASKMMAKFELDDKQTSVAAETLINILDATGLTNLTDDLKAKVELAVARAKMIAPKVEKVVEEVKEVVEDTKEAVKDVIEEKADDKKEEDVQKVLEEKIEEVKPEPEVKEEKPSIEAFKESATVVDSTPQEVGDVITADNVLQELQKVPFKDRTKFLKDNYAAFDEAMRRAR